MLKKGILMTKKLALSLLLLTGYYQTSFCAVSSNPNPAFFAAMGIGFVTPHAIDQLNQKFDIQNPVTPITGTVAVCSAIFSLWYNKNFNWNDPCLQIALMTAGLSGITTADLLLNKPGRSYRP